MIHDHPGPLLYDLRSRLGIGAADIGGAVPWMELGHLVRELLADHTSRVAMAVGGLDRPLSPEFLVLADVYDLLAYVNSDKAGRARLRRYPRGVPERTNTTGATQDEVDAAMRALGHTITPRAITSG